MCQLAYERNSSHVVRKLLRRAFIYPLLLYLYIFVLFIFCVSGRVCVSVDHRVNLPHPA